MISEERVSIVADAINPLIKQYRVQWNQGYRAKASETLGAVAVSAIAVADATRPKLEVTQEACKAADIAFTKCCDGNTPEKNYCCTRSSIEAALKAMQA